MFSILPGTLWILALKVLHLRKPLIPETTGHPMANKRLFHPQTAYPLFGPMFLALCVPSVCASGVYINRYTYDKHMNSESNQETQFGINSLFKLLFLSICNSMIESMVDRLR